MASAALLLSAVLAAENPLGNWEGQLFAGDSPPPYQKTWLGTVERRGDEFFLVTRRNTFGFINADGFHEELQRFAAQEVTITGLWRVDQIEIQKIEPGKRR